MERVTHQAGQSNQFWRAPSNIDDTCMCCGHPLISGEPIADHRGGFAHQLCLEAERHEYEEWLDETRQGAN